MQAALDDVEGFLGNVMLDLAVVLPGGFGGNAQLICRSLNSFFNSLSLCAKFVIQNRHLLLLLPLPRHRPPRRRRHRHRRLYDEEI